MSGADGAAILTLDPMSVAAIEIDMGNAAEHRAWAICLRRSRS